MKKEYITPSTEVRYLHTAGFMQDWVSLRETYDNEAGGTKKRVVIDDFDDWDDEEEDY